MNQRIIIGLMLAFTLSACAGAGADSAAQVAALEARVDELESQLAEMAAQNEGEHNDDHGGELAASPFDVAVAQYILDTAGFHALDDALAESSTIDPGYLSTVNRVRKVVTQTAWPDELHEQAEALAAMLEHFAEALEADDGAEAASLAAEVHTAQHDFSAAIDAWLGEGDGHNHGG